MRKRSILFKDRLENPINTSIFWIEHVLRHKGGNHMKSTGTTLPWYKYLLMDVFLFLIVIAAAIFYVLNKVLEYNLSLIKRGITYIIGLKKYIFKMKEIEGKKKRLKYTRESSQCRKIKI